MAYTFTKRMTPICVDHYKVLWIPVLSTAEVNLGSIVLWDATNQYVGDEMDAAADDATVIGVSGGQSPSGDSSPIQVYSHGLFLATLVSATYSHGAGLKYDDSADDGSLVADGDANTVAWFWSQKNGLPGSGSTSITEGIVLIDVARLLGKLFDVVSA